MLSDVLIAAPLAAAKPTLPRDEIDWAGRWFDLVEELQGEYVGMRGGLVQPNGATDWTFVPHARFDGLGGFVDLLRRTTAAPDLPVPSRRAPLPTVWQRAKALIDLCRAPVLVAGRWKRQDGDCPVVRHKTNAATHLFTAEETQALERQARADGGPLNALLLAALARVSADELEDGPNIWMMPVNMRGPVARPRDTANHTGYLQLDLGATATASTVQARMKESLRRRQHWGSWLFLNLGRVLGMSGMRAVYRMQMRRFGGRPFVGSFSNLGSWQGVGTWYVCPPVTLNAPVAAGAIVCDGRLSLTLEAHASMRDGDAFARCHLARWVRAISPL